MIDNREPSRAGWTLVELMVVMSISVVITSIAVTLFVSLLHQQRSTAGRHHHQEALYRLAEQFRADVRAAATVTKEPFEMEGQDAVVQLVCRLPAGQTVRYAMVNGRLRRLGPGSVDQDARETYALCDGSVVSWSVDESNESATAALIVEYPIAGEGSIRRRLPIVARVGRDLRTMDNGSAAEPAVDDEENR